MKKLTLILLTILLIGYSQSGVQSVPVIENTPTPTILPANDILSIINVYRSKQNLPALQEHHLLTAGAMKRAKDLIETNQWSHDGYVEAIRATGYKGKYIGENLARDFADNISVVEAWHKSKGHAEIMYANFKYAGIGRYEDHYVLWVGK